MGKEITSLVLFFLVCSTLSLSEGKWTSLFSFL